jgi:hypothetical protein
MYNNVIYHLKHIPQPMIFYNGQWIVLMYIMCYFVKKTFQFCKHILSEWDKS